MSIRRKRRRKKLKTRTIVLIVAGIFIAVNVTLGWVSYFITGATPDTLLTLCLGVGGVEGMITAVITLCEMFANKKKDTDQFN